jgi:hypothetical protein
MNRFLKMRTEFPRHNDLSMSSITKAVRNILFNQPVLSRSVRHVNPDELKWCLIQVYLKILTLK